MCTAIYQQSAPTWTTIIWKRPPVILEAPIGPTKMMNTIVFHDEKWFGGQLQWGMQMSFKGKNKLLLHARLESLLGGDFWADWKPCVVPIDAFVERNTQTNDPKHVVFSAPSLWLGAIWKRAEDNQGKIVIVTTNPTPVVARVHHRMPVCLQENDLKKWIINLHFSPSDFNFHIAPYR